MNNLRRRIIVSSEELVNEEYTFDYTGSSQSITLSAGTYKLEVWGAQGGDADTSNTGGLGGYSVGNITLSGSTNLYVYIGGQGISSGKGSSNTLTGTINGGFNGGGNAYRATAGSATSVGSGGGASDIRIGSNSLYSRVIVAGGGGGGGVFSDSCYGDGGEGGGTLGEDGTSIASAQKPGEGGTQTSGGISYYNSTANSASYGTVASFGDGGSGTTNLMSGGGGGWYGGGFSRRVGAGGGSGYVYNSSTASSYPSGCTLNSSYYLSSSRTLNGNTSFSSPSGGTETGHNGNGYAKITRVA